MTRRLVPLAAIAAAVVAGWGPPAEAETSGPLCGGFISIPAGAVANPYPSECVITGRTGTIVDVDVQFDGLTHLWPDHIDMLLVGPGGENAIVMSDAGGSLDAIHVDFTLDDSAGVPLPDVIRIVPGTYRPANYPPADSFPAPAPTPSGGSDLSVFNGTDPNGTWRLFVVHDGTNFDGFISDWGVTIRTSTDPRRRRHHHHLRRPAAGRSAHRCPSTSTAARPPPTALTPTSPAATRSAQPDARHALPVRRRDEHVDDPGADADRRRSCPPPSTTRRRTRSTSSVGRKAAPGRTTRSRASTTSRRTRGRRARTCPTSGASWPPPTTRSTRRSTSSAATEPGRCRALRIRSGPTTRRRTRSTRAGRRSRMPSAAPARGSSARTTGSTSSGGGTRTRSSR